METAVLNRTTLGPSRSSEHDADAPHSKAVLRQTQGLIGTVILGGAAAAFFVSMAWVIVPVIVGVGLLVAGFTGVCPMASLIARMPWNKAAESAHRAFKGDGCCDRCG